jgi:hypothetical protein
MAIKTIFVSIGLIARLSDSILLRDSLICLFARKTTNKSLKGENHRKQQEEDSSIFIHHLFIGGT